MKFFIALSLLLVMGAALLFKTVGLSMGMGAFSDRIAFNQFRIST